MNDKLKIYELLYQAYADEIKNLWQRSVFLGAFMVLVWTGYGALQLKMIEKGVKELCNYHFLSIGLCAVIIVLSLLWIAMAKGSKFVQEAHEEHIKRTKCRLFCDLDDYEFPKSNRNEKTGEKKMNEKLKPNLFFLCGTTQAYRYSPSKINIALGWLSCLVSLLLISYHIGSAIECNYVTILIVFFLIIMLVATSIITFFLKGGDKDESMALVKFLKLICVL